MNEKALEQLHEEIVSLFSNVFAVTSRALDKVAELDACGGYADMAYRSTAHYLNVAVGLSMGAAREHVRVANALRELPLLHGAFAKGTLSFSKLRALTRIATAETEEQLLTLANESTAAQLEKIVRGCRRVSGEETQRQVEERTCEYGFDADGMFFVRARLLPEEGARWLAAFEKMMQPVVPADPAEMDQMPSRRADAFVTLIEPTDKPPQTEIIVHIEQTAQTHACECPGAGMGMGMGMGSGSSRSSSIEAPLHGPVAISAETAERLACDASVVMMVHDKDGNVLDVGGRARKIPAALRRALQARDKGCRYPTCANTRTDAHHIVSWLDGGETSLANTISLCRRCHRLLHEGRFTIRTEPDGTLSFVNPHGLRISNATPLPTTTEVPQLATERWQGIGWWSQSPDYSYVTSQLLP